MQLFYCNHNSSGSLVRVWRSDWAGDMFEIISRTQLDILKEVGPAFDIRVTEDEDQGD